MARKWPKLPRAAETYSVSSFRDWECLFRGHQKRVLRSKESISPALHEGRVIHDAIAAYVTHCAEIGLPSDLSAVQPIVRAVFFDGDPEEPHSLPLAKAAEIERIVRGWAQNTLVDARNLISVEEIWAMPLEGLMPVPYMYCILDQLELLQDGRTARITDYKSDRHAKAQDEVAHDLQVWVYCWGVAQQYPQVDRFLVRMHYVRHNIVREVEFDRGIVAATHELILERVQQIRQARDRRAFPAIAGDNCGWCGFQSLCPIIQKQVDPTTIASPDEAAQAAGALHAIEARRKVLRRLLSGWTSEAGPVSVGSWRYGHVTRYGTAVADVPGAMEALVAHDLDGLAMGALRFDADGLRALLAHPEAAGVLAPFLAQTGHTEFRASRASGEVEEE